MRAGLAVLAVAGLLTAGGSPAKAAEARTWAFLLADQEGAASYRPAVQAASDGNIDGTVMRSGAGDYTVRLANASTSNGVPIVSAVNGTGTYCQLTSFGRAGADELVRVGCYRNDVPADSDFTLSFFASTQPGSGAPGAYGYVLDDQPALASYVNPATRFNSTGGRVEIRRTAADAWTARFVGQSFNNVAGNVQVSALGTQPARCGIVQWTPTGQGVDVQVRCDSTGTPQWTLMYAHDRSIVGGTSGFFGYLQADEPTADAYTPSPPRNRAPDGFAHTVSRGGPGHYQAQVYGPLKEPVDVHVSANGDAGGHCTLAGWALAPPGTQPAARVDIGCFAADGTPADRVFSLNYWSP